MSKKELDVAPVDYSVILDLRRKLEEHKGTIARLEHEKREALVMYLQARNERSRLPKERASITHKLEMTTRDGVVDIYVILGFYEDGKAPGEIFVRCSSMGSTISGFVDAWSIGVSWLLQMGVPLAEIVAKYRLTNFEPAGHVKCGEVKFGATSVVDAIVRVLEAKYLPKKEDDNGKA